MSCANCGAVLVPGLGCCNVQQAAIGAARTQRRTVVTQARTKATVPRDLPFAMGHGVRKHDQRYAPGAGQVWRTHGAPKSVAHGRDNYGMARNTTLLRTTWSPSPSTKPHIKPPATVASATTPTAAQRKANALLRATVARAQSALANAAEDRMAPRK